MRLFGYWLFGQSAALTRTSHFDARSLARHAESVSLLDPDDHLAAQTLHRQVDRRRTVGVHGHAWPDDISIEYNAQPRR
jgi:hypothetical protein